MSLWKERQDQNKLRRQITNLVRERKLKFQIFASNPGYFIADQGEVSVVIILPQNEPPRLKVRTKEGVVVYEESGYHLQGLVLLAQSNMNPRSESGDPLGASILLSGIFPGY